MSKRKRLLYIDDEEINVQLFELNFSEKFEVIGAQSGARGLEILEHDPGIDLVITDMRMPIMDGLEFIKQARKSYPEKKYFILSGFDMTPEVSGLIQQRVILNYFTKPMNIKQIEHSLEIAEMA